MRLWLLSAAVAMVTPPLAADSPWTGFDTTGYRLERDEAGYRLVRPGADPVPIPTEWLEPAGVRDMEFEVATVSSLAYDSQVTAFAAGGGRIGLHLASYDIQSRGSLQAAAGRDVFLILDPESGALVPAGPDLGVSRGRARVGGCFGARFHHVSVGDVDCDRYLDLAVVAEEVACDLEEGQGPARGVYSRGPMRWYRQGPSGWVEDPASEGRLPCAGLADLPLLAVSKTPVDFVLGFRREQEPLLSGDPEPFAEPRP